MIHQNYKGLNWREIETLAKSYEKRCLGLFVDRVFIPERIWAPGGFLKNEWGLDLSSRDQEFQLILGLKAQMPYFGLSLGKKLKSSKQASQSGFGLALKKHLQGLKIQELKAISQERMIWIGFSKLRLILRLIPANPEAFIVQDGTILASSKPTKLTEFEMPEGFQAPQNLEVRKEWVSEEDPFYFYNQVENYLKSETFSIRSKSLENEIKKRIKTEQARLNQSEKSLIETLPRKIKNIHELFSEGITDKAQIEKFYHSEKKNKRKQSEAKGQIPEILERIKTLKVQLDLLSYPHLDGSKLSEIESKIGLHAKHKTEKKAGEWKGKIFASKEGFPILVGRKKEENQELTFKIAKGNDLWFHVKGRPGAHVVVSLPPSKTASLETLLDAALLAVYYSGGENWGKTEVDYTFKKYVKRIKNSSEVSYVKNKTLVVEFDQKRFERFR